MSEQKIIELLHKHKGNAYAVDRELKEYEGWTKKNWIEKNDRVRSEYDAIKNSRLRMYD